MSEKQTDPLSLAKTRRQCVGIGVISGTVLGCFSANAINFANDLMERKGEVPYSIPALCGAIAVGTFFGLVGPDAERKEATEVE